MNQKAYIQTLTAIALGLMLLTLIGFANEMKELSSTYKEINVIERVNAKYDNIKETYFEMMKELTDEYFDYNKNTLIIYDRIPNKQKKEIFKLKTSNLKLFALQEKEDIDINLNFETKNLDLLRITPFDINYDYALNPQANKDYKTIFLSMKNTTNIKGLAIEIKLENQSFNSSDTKFTDCVNCQNPLDLNITIIDPNGEIKEKIIKTNIDAEKNNEININTSFKGKNDVKIQLNKLILTINNKNDVPQTIKTAIAIEPKINAETPKIRLDSGLFELKKENYWKKE